MKFDIYFTGHLIAGHDAAQVKAHISQHLGIQGEKLETLFSGRRIRIKQDVDVETAGKYREVFRKAGALLDIEAVAPEELAAVAAAPAIDPKWLERVGKAYELMPPDSGSLIDVAPPRVKELVVPGIEKMSMAPAGALLPEPAPTPRRRIETGQIDLAPLGATIGEPGGGMLLSSVPDISHLGQPEEGSLEEFAMPKPPVEIPNIDGMSMAPHAPGSGKPANPFQPPAGGVSVFEVD